MTSRQTSAGADKGGAGANRRMLRRYAFGLEATMESGSDQIACAIGDLSLGGAGVTPGHPDWSGAEVILRSPHFGYPQGLRARVVRSTAESAHLVFELDDDAEAALAMFLMSSPATR